MGKRKKIGVLDSGVGGLTVVKELERVLPNEEIIYFGDSINCPYGNRDAEDIKSLTRNIINFLKSKDVKAIAIACNTISAVVEDLINDYDFPIIDIITPSARYVAEKGIKDIGIIATKFTIESRCYNKVISSLDTSINVYGEGDKELAGLIDCGKFDMKKIDENIKVHMESLLNKGDIKDVILGCTHFPIVDDIFKRYGNGVNYINPALKQALEVKEYLEKNDLLNDVSNPTYEIYTSGDIEIYKTILSKLEINTPSKLKMI